MTGSMDNLPIKCAYFPSRSAAKYYTNIALTHKHYPTLKIIWQLQYINISQC